MTEPEMNPYDGEPCADFCTVDHGAPAIGSSCRGPERAVEEADEVPLTLATAQAQWFPGDKSPEVAVYVHGAPQNNGPLGSVRAASRYEAGQLAKFVVNLATMQPAEVRDLAGKIREATADAWPEQDKEAEAG